jgi:hypothetical protein
VSSEAQGCMLSWEWKNRQGMALEEDEALTRNSQPVGPRILRQSQGTRRRTRRSIAHIECSRATAGHVGSRVGRDKKIEVAKYMCKYAVHARRTSVRTCGSTSVTQKFAPQPEPSVAEALLTLLKLIRLSLAPAPAPVPEAVCPPAPPAGLPLTCSSGA